MNHMHIEIIKKEAPEYWKKVETELVDLEKKIKNKQKYEVYE